MPEKIESADKVGSVSAHRYEQIVAELRKIVEAQTLGQFAIGDYALEIEPMREQGPQDRGEELFTVKDSLFRLSEDIGLSYSAVNGARWVASRWPKQHRQARVSFTVHRILAGISNEEERFTAILSPPGGKARWTPDDASRRVGRQVERPITPQEKVSAIHTLARDEAVAAVVRVTCCDVRPWSPRSARRIGQRGPRAGRRRADRRGRHWRSAQAAHGRRPGPPGRPGPGGRGTDPRRDRCRDGDHGPAAPAGRRLQGDVGRHRPSPGQSRSGRAGPAGPRGLRAHESGRAGGEADRPLGRVPGPDHRLPRVRRGG